MFQDKMFVFCYNCADDLECFIKKNWQVLQKFPQNQQLKNLMMTHYFPSAWLCKATLTHPPIQFIKYQRTDGFFDEIKQLLLEDNVEEFLIE